MATFLVRRLLQGVIVVVAAAIFVFVATRAVGDPVDFILPLSASQEQRDNLRVELGFDRPMSEQFVDYAGDVARLDFGESTYLNDDALTVVFDYLPKTLQLVGFGMLISLVTSLPLGVLASRKPGGRLDQILTTASLTGLSMPQFFLGQVLVAVFITRLTWFDPGPGPWHKNLVLPAICMALPAVGRLAMTVRSAMIEELNSQYVKVARAKGMPGHRVSGVHALRNAGIPFVTLFGWELIRALAGYTVVVETVFAWPGLGFVLIQGIKERDFYLVQASVFVVAVVVVIISILIDVVYKALDPRVQLS
jgi:peptide/nickel transport system permease protein